MAQENGTQATTGQRQEPDPENGQAQAATQGQQLGEPDYKELYEAERRHSKKWEGIAKAKKALLDGMADPEELAEANKALEAARAEAAALRAQAEHASAVTQVAAETGLPEPAVRALRGDTAEELRASAEALRSSTSAYPLTRDQGEQKPSPLTKEAILAIKDRDKRLDAIQRNASLWN